MPTETEKKKNEFGYNEPYEPTFFEKVKYFFARLFSTVVHFFKNLFGKTNTEPPVYAMNQKISSKNNGQQKDNENNSVDKDIDKDINKGIGENKESNDIETTQINKTTTINPEVENTEDVSKDDMIIEETGVKNTPPALEAANKKDDIFIDDDDNTTIVVDEDGDIPIIPVNMLGESDDIFAEVENAEHNANEEIVTSAVEDEVFVEETNNNKEMNDKDSTAIIVEDEILDNETVEFKSLKDIFFEEIRDVDSRAISMDVNADSLSIVFELEDESNILITLMQNGEIKNINKMESDFEQAEDDMNLSAFKRKMTPVTINEIGFTGTAKELSKLMQENPDIINKIYNSKNEIERRENKMVADAMQVKVDNIEDLKDILLGYLETANRNVITYDMQDKAILVKLPTKDSQDVNVMEMERDLVINLVDMSYNIKVEKMDFTSRSGGYKTEFEDVDLNKLGAKFVAIHEAIKANSEFFAKDLSTDGPVEDTSYEEYIEDIFEDEDNDKSRSSSRQRDKEKTMARNAAIKNKENSRSQRNGDDDEEKKPQKKQHFRHNRDEDDYDL